MKNALRILVTLWLLCALAWTSGSFAVEATQSSPNYLIVLVHGVNSSSRVFVGQDQGSGKGVKGSDLTNEPPEKDSFGDLKGYLENDLGLNGYVYSYTFSDRDGAITKQGKEFGKSNESNPAWQGSTLHYVTGDHLPYIPGNYTKIKEDTSNHQGNCWIKQARDDFKEWYAKQQKPPIDPKDVPESVIPSKYIIIAHSMGGLAAREYIFSDDYSSEVESLITIDTPHLGSTSARMLKEINDLWKGDGNGYLFSSGTTLYFASLASQMPFLAQSGVDVYLCWCALAGAVVYSQVDGLVQNKFGWYYQQPAVQDMDPYSGFLSQLNNKKLKTGASPLKVRLIAGEGVPTPSMDFSKTLRFVYGIGAIADLTSSSYWNELPEGGRFMSLYLSLLLGTPVNKNGDFMVTRSSQWAEGVPAFNDPRIDLKKYDRKFAGSLSNDTVIGITLAADAAYALSCGNSLARFFVILGGALASAAEINSYSAGFLDAHGQILKASYEDKIIDHALEDCVNLGGKTDTTASRSGISASAINTPTAGYDAPEQAFVLLSDLDTNKNPTGVYHTVTIEAFTEAEAAGGISFPVEVNGVKKWVSAVTVKEAPTAVKGVINTFLPKKMKKFNYSENFAAWKGVPAVDEWGNFTLKDLKLAEGQNVIAFDAESWIGNRSNQHLKIVLNTIPQYVNSPYPEPNAHTNNVRQLVGVTVSKAVLSGDPAEKILLEEFLIDGVNRKSEVEFISTLGTYTAEAKVKWMSKEPLPEGEHTVLVKFGSNVGVSQAIWSYYIDTTAPVITVATLEPYSPRAPTAKKLDIKYTTSDNYSQFLKNISARVYKGTTPDEDTNFVAGITTIATQAAGEQYVNWDGKDGNGNFVSDGIYTVRIKGYDEANNWSAGTGQVKVDSTPPEIIEAHVSPNPMTKASNEFGFAGKISEQSTVILKLTNQSENHTTLYLAQSSVVASGASESSVVSYLWRFDDPFTPNLKDGLYKIEVSARDEAGNESAPRTLEAVRIDRTPPVVSGQYTDPFVLSNIGANPYKTTLRYRVSESNDLVDNRQSTAENLNVKVKLYNENTGENLWSQNSSGSLTDENTFPWIADSSFGKGAYKFQIVATDHFGNYSTAYASCVKDGVAPVISSPSGGDVSGTVTIRGTAMDPDWTNSLKFKEYRVYYKKGNLSAATNPSGWETSLIEVPEIYRPPGSAQRNISIRPVQNDATLAYFYAGSLGNDTDYTILVVAEEEGGAKYASARTVHIKNDGVSASSIINPVAVLSELPSEITFDGKNYLPISFTCGGKDTNVYVEIMKVTGSGTRETAYYKYFPKLVANYYSGKPTYQSGNELGYFVWQDADGWHMRWNGESGKEHRFNGSIIVTGGISDFKNAGNGAKQISSLVSWDKKMSGGEGGFDFKINSGQLIISSYLDNDPAASDDDFTSSVVPYFGMSKYQPASAPVMISGISNQSGSAGQSISWDGKVESGAFVDSGNYIVRVRAEGMDGVGLTMVEKTLKITTPFGLNNVKAGTISFNPLGLPDRVTVAYNISKDAAIKLKVYQPGQSEPLAIIDDGIQPGKTNADYPHTISWRGNFPDKEGTQVVTSGDYTLKLIAEAADGSALIERTINPNIRVETLGAFSSVRLDPIGEEKIFNGETVRATQGSSYYYWEAKATGNYYPTVPYSCTLGMQGKQKAKVYPYVPFSGLIHRSFDNVDVQVDVTATIQWTRYGYVWLQGWKDYGESTDRFYSKEVALNKGKQATEDDFITSQYKIWDFKSWDEFSVGQAVGEPWPHINRINLHVVVRPKRDSSWVLDEISIVSDNYGVNRDLTGKIIPPGESIPSDKGIFVISPSWEHWWGNNFGFGAKFSVKVGLADGVENSRLTNRFIPWYGFVNQNHPKNTDDLDGLNIPLLMTDITKLGFPGRDFFIKPGVTIKGENKAEGEYQTVLNNMTNYKTYAEFKAALDAVGKKAYYEGYSGNNAAAGGYDTFLSGETFAFVPIAPPSRSDINGNPIPGCGFSQDGMRWTAKVNYEMDYNVSPLAVKWPYDRKEVSALEKTYHTDRLAELNKNPQSYNISNTAYEIDKARLESLENDFLKSNPGLVMEGGEFKRKAISGSLSYDRALNGYQDNNVKVLKELIDPPDYVFNYTYADADKSLPDLSLTYTKTSDKNSFLTAGIPALAYAQNWSTGDDPVLRDYGNGKLRGGSEVFNAYGFRADGKSAPHYFKDAYRDNYLKYQNYFTAGSDAYTFLAEEKNPASGKIVENPHLKIDGWQVTLKDEAGEVNQDLEIKDNDIHAAAFSGPIDHYFQAKLKYQAKEKRLVKLTGNADSYYELMYFDGQKWVTFAKGEPVNGTFSTFWDVGRLCGKYTILLKTNRAIASQDIYIGDIVYYGLDDPENKRVTSAYRRAEVVFKATSFSKDQFASVTPVTMSEIYIRNKPIIKTHGPILELKPSPCQFKTPAEGEDLRPYIRFLYTADDLEEGYGIVTSPDDPDWKIKTQDLWIHQVTADGNLELIQDKTQKLEYDETTKQNYFAFEAAADHFSTYALLKGKFSLSAPMVLADRYITNKDSATIYGTAEPGSIVSVYVFEEPRNLFAGSEPKAVVTASPDRGNFRFENVPLLREGNNYLYVTSHPQDTRDVMTYSDVTIIKDTVPPSVEAKQNLYAFSPNGDGKYDSVDYYLKTNESGRIFIQLLSGSIPILSQDISAEAEKEIKLTWAKESFRIFRRDGMTGEWLFFSEIPISERLADGTYHSTVYAIDEAGNISNNVISQTIIDTTPPAILGLNADPNPFTPNDDGVKDTIKFWYKFSEPAYTTLSIFRDDGKLFRSHKGPTENFIYPTFQILRDQDIKASSGEWEWDGRGSRNELLGGEYAWEVYAEDRVGNSVSSEVRTIVVDRAPSLVPYAFAEPDPFAPVNPDNNFTDIKYYLSRDNLKISVSVLGEEDKPVKTLVNNEFQGKGEHLARWYGDFDGDPSTGSGQRYSGPAATKNKYRVGDGSWQFRVYAADPDGGQPADVTNTVLVDNVPPYIAVKPVQVDYINKKATLNYNLPENSSVEAGVYDAEGNLIETLITAEAKVAGDYALNYSFPSAAGSPGRYFRIIATDRAKNTAERTTEAFAVVANQFQIAAHSAAPSPFTPNGDSLNDQTRISYILSGGAGPYTVSINISNAAGAAVRRLIENESQSAGAWSFYWDGSPLPLGEGSGVRVPDGYYEYVITAEDKLGTKVEGRGTILSISTRPTVDLSASLPVFSPNGDGSKDKVTFNYSINYPTFYLTGEALVKIEMLNASGEAVWSKIFNRTAGAYVYEYDGLVSDGVTLEAGNYYVRASAEDALGSTATSKTVNLAVDCAMAAQTTLSVEPNPFSPNGDGVKDQVVITYGFAEPAYVSVLVKSADGQLIKSLVVSQLTDSYISPSGVRTFAVPVVVWEGKDDSGSPAADGNHSICLIATDEAGNTSTCAALITLDNTRPVTPEVSALPGYTGHGSQTITGTAEPNAVVTLYNNERFVKTASADAAGLFSIPANLSMGGNNIKLSAADAAGNTSGFSASQPVNYETDAPVILSVEVSPNPARAGPVTIAFTVSETLESDPIVRINGNTAARQSVNGLDYAYSYNVTNADQQGQAFISIEATDLANNQAKNQANNLLTIDTIDPVKPTMANLPGNTNQQTILISGEAEAGTSVKIYRNSVLFGETSAASVFSKEIDLGLGSNVIYVVSVDSAGNQSEASDSQTINYDVTSPVFSYVNINPDPARAGPVAMTFVSSKTLEADPIVTINNRPASFNTLNGLTYIYVYNVANNDSQGTAAVQIQGMDLAGNSGLKTADFTIDTIKPVVSSVSVTPNPAKAGSVAISFDVSEELKNIPLISINGTPAANVSKPGGNYIYNYNILSSDQQGPAVISIEATDLAVNATRNTYNDLLIIDTIAPAKPVVDPLPSFTNVQTLKVTGKAEVNSKVKIFNDEKYIMQISADAGGEFNASMDLELGNNFVYVLVEDPAGNASEASDLQAVVFDTENPVFSVVSITPDPAGAGPVIIKFNSSKFLKEDPTVKVNGKPASKGDADNLTYTYAYDVKDSDQQGTARVEIGGVDLAGNSGSKTAQFVIDTINPEVSNVSVTPNLARECPITINFTVSETLEANPIVRINEETAPIYRGRFPVQTGWNYEYVYNVSPSDKQGAANIAIEIKDIAGNPTIYQANNLLTIDTIAPLKPVLDQLPGYTSQDNLVVSGTAEANATVKIYKNGSEAALGKANGSGSFSLPITLSGGNNNLYAAAADAAGNVSQASATWTVVLDKTAPAISLVSATPSLAKAGPVTIKFTVSEILKGNPIVKVNGNTAESGGISGLQYTYNYNVKISDKQGTATISIEVTDLAGNPAKQQYTNLLTLDTISPAVSLASTTPSLAKTGNVVIGFTVSETLLSNPIVKVNGNSAAKESSSGLNYKYNYPVGPSDKQGVAAVLVEVTDPAGNAASKSYSDILTIDTVAPVKPVLDQLPGYTSQDNLVVSGTAEVNSTVKIYKNGSEETSGKANGSGSFSLPVTLSGGNNSLYAAAADAAGNVSSASDSQTVILDQTVPAISNIDIKSQNSKTRYAKAGDNVTIDFSISEELKQAPAVTVNGKPANSCQDPIKRAVDRIDYYYKYTVSETDSDGAATVSINVEDLAGNKSSASPTFVIDKGTPEIFAVTVPRNPANAGSLNIDFTASDATSGINGTPTVEVTQYLGDTIICPVTLLSGNTYRATYTVITGRDGTASILVRTNDKALNFSSRTQTFEVDTASPGFGSVTSYVIGNPEYSKYAKAGSMAVISFEASEALKDTPAPVVKINGNPAELDPDSSSGRKYAFKYTVSPSDSNGQAAILINGYDLANNYGEYSTSKLSESFVVDVTAPVVTKMTDPQSGADMIALPAHFATNSDPDDQAANGIPKSTALHYKVSEDSRVTLSIHKIPDTGSSTVYKKEDFNTANKIISFDMGRQTGGEGQTKTWDGKIGNDYGVPGKYAFIVTARDDAGNVTEIKYGGTFWIQDNVLRLIPPDQLPKTNPDPLFISPFGNTPAGSDFKRARIYFRINLGLTPKAIWSSEWISAMEAGDIDWDKYAGVMKKVGTCLIKVYSEAGSLIWTSPVRDAYSARDHWEDWGGVDQNGQKVDDGRYKMVVEVKDFRGQPAFENTLGDKWVTVDNTSPNKPNIVADVSHTPENNWSTHNTPYLTWADPGDSGGSGVVLYHKKVDGNSWEVSTNPYHLLAFSDGIHSVWLKAFDGAGNESASDEAVFKIDTVNPSFKQLDIDHTPKETWSTHNTPYITYAVTDETSGVSSVEGFIDGITQGNISSGWHPTLSDGKHTVKLRVYDNAGLYVDSGVFALWIDTTPPNVPSVSVFHTIAGNWSNHNSPYFTWSDPGDGNGSGVSYYKGFIDGKDQGAVPSGWHPTLGEGTHTVFVRVVDGVDCASDSQSSTFYIDVQNPGINWGGQVSDTWYSADNAITISLSDNLSCRGFKWSWDSWPSTDPGGCDTSTSGTTYHSSQGTRTLYARAWDQAGNRVDDSRTYKRDSVAPTIIWGTLTPNPFNQMYQSANGTVTITDNYSSQIKCYGYICTSDWKCVRAIFSYGSDFTPTGNKTFVWDGKNDAGDYVNKGDYYFCVRATDEAGNTCGNAVWVYARDDIYIDRGWYPYQAVAYGENGDVWWPQIAVIYPNADLWVKWVYQFNGNGPMEIHARKYSPIDKSLLNGTSVQYVLYDSGYQKGWSTATDNNQVVHQVWSVMEGQGVYARPFIYYKRGQSPNIKISEGENPVIAVDGINAYVAWRKGLDLYLQKIPSNFAPINGTVTMAVKPITISHQASTLESPTLISPEKDKQNVSSLRPTFEWRHHKGDATQYNIDIAKNDTFSFTRQTFSKSANTGLPDKTDSSLYYYNYSIHEFDPGLDRDTYFWKVTALSTNEAATSEVWSFKITPDLTLTGVTNYPNPFNPNKEKAKIRYRLGADADEVKIRIYDITGSLVNELDGTTNGEGASVWNKYNDVEWNGRNGRGDIVMNGIYPFEVVARLGDRSVSGRGKIAVLK